MFSFIKGLSKKSQAAMAEQYEQTRADKSKVSSFYAAEATLKPEEDLLPFSEDKQSGLLWKIVNPNDKDEGSSYILGTSHYCVDQNKVEDIVFTQFYHHYLDEKCLSKFILELDPTAAQSYFAEVIKLPKDISLRHLLTDELIKEIHNKLNIIYPNKPELLKQIDELTPASVAVIISSGLMSTVVARHSKPTLFGHLTLDQQLAIQARDKCSSLFIETPEEQYKSLGLHAPLAEQIQLLQLMLKSVDKFEENFMKLQGAFINNDPISLYTQMLMQSLNPASGTEDEKKFSKAFIEALIGKERNERMANAIVKILQDSSSFYRGRAFITIGVAHLLGENGVLNLLRKQGYKVTCENRLTCENILESKLESKPGTSNPPTRK